MVFVTRSVHNHCWCSFTIHSRYRKIKDVQFVYNLVLRQTFFEIELFLHKEKILLQNLIITNGVVCL